MAATRTVITPKQALELEAYLSLARRHLMIVDACVDAITDRMGGVEFAAGIVHEVVHDNTATLSWLLTRLGIEVQQPLHGAEDASRERR
jgi:hypothetical protein